MARTAPKVLVVEDEGIVALDISRTLSGLGFQVVGVVPTAEEALEIAAMDTPSLALMDIRIKGSVDGIDAADQLRREFGVSVIFLTAHGDRETLERAKLVEPMGYVLKPFKRTDLQVAVEIALTRREMEKKLRERERLLATTLRSIGDAVITTDRNGAITFMNPVAESMTEWDHRHAHGHTLADVVHLQDERTGAPMPLPTSSVLGDRRTASIESATLVGRRGAQRVVADSFAPVVDDDELCGAVIVLQDVTERRRLQRQIEVADRLASLNTMGAGVAHEINNPLTYVIANLEFALDEMESVRLPAQLEGTREALQEAREGADRIASIVSNLKRLTRNDSGGDTVQDVRRTIEWAITVTGHEWRPRARVETELGDVPPIAADPTRIGQVFVNLMTNAAQAIPPGRPDIHRIRVTSRTDASGAAVVEVTDSGSGIPREARARIFEPFFTTKPVGKGTGLGLSVCHSVVESMGGTIQVETTEGSGTTFRVTIPAAPADAPVSASDAPRGRRVEVTGGRGGRILVIDDEASVARAIARCLGGGHSVTVCPSAEVAIAHLAAGEHFDVILCDLVMPGMNGLEFFEELGRRWPELQRRFVFVTGTAGGVDATVRQIRKPFSPEFLTETVAAVLEQPT